MQIEEKLAASKVDYQGRAYYFCSDACRKTFSADPARYAKSVAGDPGRPGEPKR
jgi:Cu+-exporting ATPase